MVRKTVAWLAALGLWAALAALLQNELLLPRPWAVVTRLLELLASGGFWLALGHSFLNIAAGFLASLLCALILGSLAGRWSWAESLLQPYMTLCKTVPVASFILLAFLWVSGEKLSILIAFLMALPVLYGNVLQGVRSADRSLFEMAAVYRMGWLRRLRCLWLPQLSPWLRSGCAAALGLAWKAGVAAEVISVARHSMGEGLYEAKLALDIPALFGWTAAIVAVSVAWEKLFMALLNRGMERAVRP